MRQSGTSGFVCNTAPSVPVTLPLHCCCWLDWTKPHRSTASNREPNLAKKWIGQKKAIRQWQVYRNFYDDAIEVLLKFCGGAIKVL